MESVFHAVSPSTINPYNYGWHLIAWVIDRHSNNDRAHLHDSHMRLPAACFRVFSIPFESLFTFIHRLHPGRRLRTPYTIVYERDSLTWAQLISLAQSSAQVYLLQDWASSRSRAQLNVRRFVAAQRRINRNRTTMALIHGRETTLMWDMLSEQWLSQGNYFCPGLSWCPGLLRQDRSGRRAAGQSCPDGSLWFTPTAEL